MAAKRLARGRASGWQHLSALCALAVVAWSLPAAGGRLAVVSRGVGPGSEKAAALVGHFAAEAMASDERYELINGALALGNPDRDRALRQFQVADDLSQKAREAYDGLDLDRAESSLRGALGRYERYSAYIADLKKMADALLLLGAVRILKGNERGASLAFEQAIGMVPNIEPDPRVFNPAMRVHFGQSVAKVGQLATGGLAVTSAPSYSSVFVDGRFVGVTGGTPLPIESIAPGRHIVRVEREGFRPFGAMVDVVSHGEAAVQANLRPTVHFDEFDSLVDRAARAIDGGNKERDERLTALRSLAELFDADSVLLSRVRLDGERVRIMAELYEMHGKKPEQQAEHAFAYDTQPATYKREVRAFLHEEFDFAADTDRRKGESSGEKAEAHEDDDSKGKEAGLQPRAGLKKNCGLMTCVTLKKASVGGLIGVGGAAMVMGGVEWILAKRSYNAWRATSQVATNQSSRRATAYNHAIFGDVLMAGGIVGVVGGVILAAAWHPHTSVSDVAEAEGAEPLERHHSGNSRSLASLRPAFLFAPTREGATVVGQWELP